MRHHAECECDNCGAYRSASRVAGRAGLALAALLAVLLAACAAGAQVLTPGVPTSGEETLTVSTTALGVTANLCGPGNKRGALVSVNSNGIYVSFHGPTVTPDSGDFAFNATDRFFVRPAYMLRMIRQSADSAVKIQCTE